VLFKSSAISEFLSAVSALYGETVAVLLVFGAGCVLLELPSAKVALQGAADGPPYVIFEVLVGRKHLSAYATL